MRLRKNRQDDISINTTPFIDILLVLLIFFMVTTTFKKYDQLNVELPRVAEHKKAEHPNTITVGIDKNGNYFLQGAALQSAEPRILKNALQLLLAKTNHNMAVVILGDKAAPHQAVVSAMDVAGQLGVTQLQIVALK